MTLRYRVVSSPIGDVVLSGGDRLQAIRFDVPAEGTLDHRAFADAGAQLREYFAGERRVFELDVDVQGTPYQSRVWAALVAIPFGATRTYAELATIVGSAPRAVGSANARNPLSIIVPCHRLVGSAGGQLRGYAGGLDRKRWLLDHERATVARDSGGAAAPGAAQ